METITKFTRELGTSSGVVLPKNWINKKVQVTLLELSIEDILKEIIQILYKKELLKDIQGLYLTGSYARKDYDEKSDIDILAITKNTDKILQIEKYNLVLISENKLKKQIKENALYIYPMIIEAKTLINKSLIETYKKSNLTKKDISNYLESTKKILKINKKMINLDKKLKSTKTADDVAYSLILRLRGIYILECLVKNKKYYKKDFMKLLKKIKAEQIYNRYLHTKTNNSTANNTILIKDAERLISDIKNKIKKLENDQKKE